MKIVAISDTHQLHNELSLPDGDILIHCGDFTNRGTDGAMHDFLNWFSSQPHEYKVFISGNHELGLDRSPTRNSKLNLIKSYTERFDKLFYLENSTITINGYKIYGSPITPFFYDWAWNVRRGDPISIIWSQIPDDTNILITHGPPYGLLDLVSSTYLEDRNEHQGCEDLLARINKLQNLKLHVFGHLHLQGGQSTIQNNCVFANASSCDDSYNVIHKPIVVDL